MTEATSPAPESTAPPQEEGTAEHSAGEVVRAALQRSVDRLNQHAPQVLQSEDPEEVHQARVATRRLRSDLRTFRPLLHRDWADAQRRRLQPFAAALGTVRDADVLLERLRSGCATLSAADRPAGDRLIATLEAQREQRKHALLESLRSEDFAALVDSLHRAAEAPQFTATAAEPAVETLPQLARKAWRRLRRRVSLAGGDPADTTLHEIRILAKRARYASEAVASVCSSQVTAFAKQIAGLQDVLGRQHDAVTAEQWLRSEVDDDGADPIVVGQLIALERASAVTGREEWRAAWKRVRAAHPSSWT